MTTSLRRVNASKAFPPDLTACSCSRNSAIWPGQTHHWWRGHGGDSFGRTAARGKSRQILLDCPEEEAPWFIRLHWVGPWEMVCGMACGASEVPPPQKSDSCMDSRDAVKNLQEAQVHSHGISCLIEQKTEVSITLTGQQLRTSLSVFPITNEGTDV